MPLFLLLSLFLVQAPARAEYDTIEDLVRANDDEPCRACHEGIHDKRRSSRHGRVLVNSLVVFREFVETGVKRNRKRD